MDPLAYPGRIISIYEYVEFGQEVLLLRRSWGTYLWWAQHSEYLVGYRREFLPASMLIPDIFFSSQNFPRQMISLIVICLFIFGLIKGLLPDACPSIPWYCVLHGSHVEFEMDLETVVVFWLDICLWWYFQLTRHYETQPIIQIIDPSDPSSRSAPETEEFAHFKRDIYQKVLKIIFKSLRHRSHGGDAHRCADGINRILYPGILIESQDAEEAAYFCGCRAARANHPCPKCLVSHSELHEVSAKFTLRTPTNMRAALERVASAKTKSEKQRILVKYGLHNIPVRKFCFQVWSEFILNVKLCSTSCGTSVFLIHIRQSRMIPCTLTT